MRRESFSDSCVNTCRKWPSVPFTQNLKYATRTVYKVCAFCPNLRHPRASYPQDSDKRLFLIPLLTACSAQNLHVFIVLSTLAPLCFGFLQQCVVLIIFLRFLVATKRFYSLWFQCAMPTFTPAQAFKAPSIFCLKHIVDFLVRRFGTLFFRVALVTAIACL